MEAGPYDPANTGDDGLNGAPVVPQWRRGLTTPQTGQAGRQGHHHHGCRNGGGALRPRKPYSGRRLDPLSHGRNGGGALRPRKLGNKVRAHMKDVQPQWRRGLTTPQTCDGCRRRHLAGGRNGGGALRPRKPAAVVAGRAVVGSRNGGGALRPRKRPLPENVSLCTSLPQWRRGLTTPQTANSKNES